MRPISSNINAPTEKLAGWLVKILEKVPDTHGHSGRNSVDLVNEIKDFKVRRSEILVSFDVVHYSRMYQ